MSFELEQSDIEEVVPYTPKIHGKYKVPSNTKIKGAFDKSQMETVMMPIEELINIEEWLGNRNSEARLEDQARRDAMSGEFDLAHGIHFEVGELRDFGVWKTRKGGRVVHSSHQPGSRFLLNGNTRAWGIRKGYFDSVPSHVAVNILKVDTLEDMQQLYWKMDSKLSLETVGDVFTAAYDDLGFVPKSNQYAKTGGFGTALSRYGALINPKLWGNSGFSAEKGVFPLDHEDVIRAQNRLRQEMFDCYIEEMRFNDEQMDRKKTADQRWDSTCAIAHMIKFRVDGFKVTPLHQEVLDAIFDGNVRTPDKVNTPIQFILAEMCGLGHSSASDSKVEFPMRGNWGNPVIGAKPAVAKHLFYLVQMEQQGCIDKPCTMKRSVTKGGKFDYLDWLLGYLHENRILFAEDSTKWIGNVSFKKPGRKKGSPNKRKSSSI
jgi:hypothetical protein